MRYLRPFNVSGKNTRLHPLLPTPDEVRENFDIVYSDHLPRLFNVPTHNPDRNLKVLSYNILNAKSLIVDMASGYYYPDSQFSNELHSSSESIENQNNDRKVRLFKSIRRMVKEHQPDIIALQEEWFTIEDALTHLCTSLGPDWLYVNKGHGQPILYNTKTIEDVKSPEVSEEWKRNRQEIRFNFYNDTFIFHNAHIPHEEVPKYTEDKIESLFNLTPKQPTIVVGDFNSRFVPEDKKKRYIVGNVVPGHFRFPEHQGVDWTDGAFSKQPGQEIEQVGGIIINPETGDEFVSEKIKLRKNYSETEREEFTRPRLHLCLAHNFRTQNIAGKALQAHQNDLRLATQQDGLIVSFARNAENEEFIGIAFEPGNKLAIKRNGRLLREAYKESQNYLLSILSQIKDIPTLQAFSTDNYGKPPVIFVKPEYFGQLLNRLQPEASKLQEIENQQQPQKIKNIDINYSRPSLLKTLGRKWKALPLGSKLLAGFVVALCIAALGVVVAFPPLAPVVLL